MYILKQKYMINKKYKKENYETNSSLNYYIFLIILFFSFVFLLE